MCHRSPCKYGEHEAGYVGTLYIIYITVGLCTVFYALGVNVVHDLFQTGVDFFFGPAQFDGVLRHFKTAHRYATGVGGFTRSVENLGFEELFDGFGGRGHVGAFRYGEATVGQEGACIVTVDFVLGGRRHGDVAFLVPGTCTFDIFATVFLGIFADTTTVDVFQFEDVGQFLGVDAIGVVDVSVAVGHGDDFGSEADEFFYGVLGYVTRTRYGYHFAFDVDVAGFQHFEQEVNVSVTRGFGTNERTAEFETFSGERPGIFTGHLLVHAIHVTYFSATYSDVTGGNVGLRADVTPQFGDESLAETHDFSVGFAARAEIGPPFATTHGKGRQRVLEGLLESKEFQNREVYR